MKVTDSAVQNWASRAVKAGIILRKSEFVAPAWPDEDVELLKRLWGEGLGPAVISRKTGWSTNRIGSKARTLGLPKRAYPLRRASPRLSAEQIEAKRRLLAAQRSEASLAASAAREEARRLREGARASLWDVTLTSRPFLDRQASECSWPLGDSGAFHACCDPVQAGDSYCAKHRLVAGGGRTDPQNYRSTVSLASTKRGPASVFDAGRMAA